MNIVMKNFNDLELAKKIYGNCKDFEPCNYGDCLHLAFCDSATVDVNGVKTTYNVVVVFSEEQENGAKNDDGVIDDWGRLDWDNPQEIVITEV